MLTTKNRSRIVADIGCAASGLMPARHSEATARGGRSRSALARSQQRPERSCWRSASHARCGGCRRSLTELIRRPDCATTRSRSARGRRRASVRRRRTEPTFTSLPMRPRARRAARPLRRPTRGCHQAAIHPLATKESLTSPPTSTDVTTPTYRTGKHPGKDSEHETFLAPHNAVPRTSPDSSP